MQVILLSDVKGTGKKGGLVKIADGFGRYLIRKELAKEATDQAILEFDAKKKSEERKILEEEKELKKIAEKVNEKTITLFAKGGENGKLFGSITSKDISEKLKEIFGVEIEKRKIHLTEDIKTFGTYKCKIKLHFGIFAVVYAMVVEG